MSIIDTIKKEQMYHRKHRYTEVAAFYTTLLSEAQMVGKNDGGRETTDDEVITIVKKFIKNGNEVLTNLDDSDVRYKIAEAEIDLLNQLLPKQMSDDELDEFIANIIDAYALSSPKDMGVIMKELKENRAGLFDGRKASSLAKNQLVIQQQIELNSGT